MLPLSLVAHVKKLHEVATFASIALSRCFLFEYVTCKVEPFPLNTQSSVITSAEVKTCSNP